MVGYGTVRLYLVMYGFVMQIRYGNVAYCDAGYRDWGAVLLGYVW